MTTHKLRPIADLIIPPERQRKEFDPVSLLSLATSIKENGLFHAIQVRQDGQTVVSGERRLRAIKEHLMPFGQGIRYDGTPLDCGVVPIVLASSDDPLELEEIELAENRDRKDLTWKEMAETTARLHALRQAQAARAGLPPQTVAATAIEVRGSAVGSPQEETRKEILVAANLDKPEVANAPDLKSAFKALKRIEDADRNRALALAVGETYSTAAHKVFNTNCLAWMADPQWHGRFSCIFTDPPYGMGAHEFGDGAGRLEGIQHHYDDSYEAWKPLMSRWAELSYRVAAAEAHAYVWCDIDRFHELKSYMEAAGWYVFRTPLTNYKANSGRVPLPDMGPRRQSEWCLYAIKGKKKTNFIASDVITTGADVNLSHGAQKPVELYVELLRRSIKPGDWVLDSFAGTGPILAAATELKVYAVALEQNPEYYGICLTRLAELSRQGELL
jgi:DNA modification methylase/ParB-like chromosome segregation protein Spo0J